MNVSGGAYPSHASPELCQLLRPGSRLVRDSRAGQAAAAVHAHTHAYARLRAVRLRQDRASIHPSIHLSLQPFIRPTYDTGPGTDAAHMAVPFGCQASTVSVGGLIKAPKGRSSPPQPGATPRGPIPVASGMSPERAA